MAQKTIPELDLLGTVDDNSLFPVDNGIQTFRTTGLVLKNYISPIAVAAAFALIQSSLTARPPVITKLTSGSGTFARRCYFKISTGSATIGATYTNNGFTFTVKATVASGTVLETTGTGAPTSTGTLTKASGTGDATLTFSATLSPLYLTVEMLGGGGGGSGFSGSSGSDGNDSTFGTALLIAAKGKAATSDQVMGVESTGSSDGGLNGIVQEGEAGYGGVSNTAARGFGGHGGNSAIGAGGRGPYSQSGVVSGVSASANSGGGGGGQASGANSQSTGQGGGAGGYVRVIIPSPNPTYAYSVGAGGNGGSSAGNGGSGLILVVEHFPVSLF